MNSTLLNIFILLASIALTFAGCGGGGASSASSTSTSSLSTPGLPVTTAVTATASTSTNISTVTVPLSSSITGLVINSSGIEGLTLKCNSTKITTSIDGAFECATFPLSAYLGEYKLGEVAALPFDKIIYTQDFMGIARGATTHPSVTKISMILQSLDEDASPLNGITISSESMDFLGSHLRADSKLEEMSIEDVKYIIKEIISTSLVQNKNSKLKEVDENTAQLNLTTMTAKMPAASYAQRSIGRN